MIEGIPEPLQLDMQDVRVQRFYPQIYAMAAEYHAGQEVRLRNLVDHLGYMQKIFGKALGGAVVGSALLDARHIADLPACPERELYG